MQAKMLFILCLLLFYSISNCKETTTTNQAQESLIQIFYSSPHPRPSPKKSVIPSQPIRSNSILPPKPIPTPVKPIKTPTVVPSPSIPKPPTPIPTKSNNSGGGSSGSGGSGSGNTQTAPTKSPSNIKINSVTTNSFQVQWEALSQSDAGNLAILFYGFRISYTDPSTSKQQVTLITVPIQNITAISDIFFQETKQTLSYSITNLLSHVQYAVQMKATNQIGDSPYSSAIQVTTLEDNSQFVFTIVLSTVIPAAAICLCLCILTTLLCTFALIVAKYRATKKHKPIVISYATVQSNPFAAHNSSVESKELISPMHTYATNYKIDYKLLDFSESKILGSGGQGMVVTAKYFDTPVAVKFFSKHMMMGSSEQETEQQQEFYNEAKFLAQHSNFVNIIRFIGIAEDVTQGRVALVTELCSGGSLAEKVEKEILDFDTKVRILFGVSCGMRYLHANQIIHRDLKCENVLLDAHNVPKIIDFGFSKQIETLNKTMNMTVNVGTAAYIAPEAICLEIETSADASSPFNNSNNTAGFSKGSTNPQSGSSTDSSQKKQYDRKMDVYSFAIMMLVVYTDKKNPYGRNISAFQIMNQLAKNPHYRPPVPETVPVEHLWYIDLMKKCWRTDPKRRPEFDQISAILQQHLKK